MLSFYLRFIFFIICFSYGSQGASILETGGIVPVVKFGTKSYYFSDHQTANFFQANHVCAELGMRLVTIPNKEVNQFLYQTINSAQKITRYWTSGTTLINGKNWVWLSTKEPVTYTNWMPGQPDAASERCFELQLLKKKVLQWNNLDCSVRLNFICESQDVSDKGEIPNNWQGAFANPSISPNFPVLNYNKNSYYIGNVNLSYFKADRFCKLIGMELVSIESKEESDSIYNYIRNTMAGKLFWSAGTRLVDGINWYWLPYGRKVTYTNWQKGQPDSKVEHCIQLQFIQDSGLSWNDLSCSVSQNFICKAPTDKVTACSIIDPNCERPDPKNPNPTIPAPPSFHIGKETVTYTDAINKCHDLGLKLVSIQNKAKQEAVNKFISESAYTDWIWTSGNRIADKKTWSWLSGEAVAETFWNDGEPNNANGQEECMTIKKKEELSVWNDTPCSSLHYYLCESTQEQHNSQTCCNQPSVVNVFIDNQPRN